MLFKHLKSCLLLDPLPAALASTPTTELLERVSTALPFKIGTRMGYLGYTYGNRGQRTLNIRVHNCIKQNPRQGVSRLATRSRENRPPNERQET